MNNAAKIVKLVFNFSGPVGDGHRMFEAEFLHCVETGEPLPEELSDIFHLQILYGVNSDGSNRGLITYK